MCKNFGPFSIPVAALIRRSKMQVQGIESNRGGKIALHDSHSYNQKQSTINCIHWRCTKYYKLQCPAILKIKNETTIETKSTHNHECNPGECKAKEVVKPKNQIKRRAQYSTPTMAITNEIYEISDDYAVQLAMPKKRQPVASSLSKTTKSDVFKYLPQLFEAGIMDCRRILVVLRRIFGCSYGTWKKIRKCRSLKMFKKLPDYCAPSPPDTKK